MKQVMIEFTNAERILFNAEFEFWHTVSGLDCRTANQMAYDKIVRKRKLAKRLRKEGQTH